MNFVATGQPVDVLDDAETSYEVVALQQCTDPLQLFFLADVHRLRRVDRLAQHRLAFGRLHRLQTVVRLQQKIRTQYISQDFN